MVIFRVEGFLFLGRLFDRGDFLMIKIRTLFKIPVDFLKIVLALLNIKCVFDYPKLFLNHGNAFIFVVAFFSILAKFLIYQ